MKSELKIENLKTPQTLGVAIKRLRKQKRLSQAGLAKLMNMRQPTISDIESGKGTLESLFKIIQALKINLAISIEGLPKSKKTKSKAEEMIDLLSIKAGN